VNIEIAARRNYIQAVSGKIEEVGKPEGATVVDDERRRSAVLTFLQSETNRKSIEESRVALAKALYFPHSFGINALSSQATS
jgi:hypothetical protein